jgi:hypothetical protein
MRRSRYTRGKATGPANTDAVTAIGRSSVNRLIYAIALSNRTPPVLVHLLRILFKTKV